MGCGTRLGIKRAAVLAASQHTLSMQGPKGQLERQFHELVTVAQDGEQIKVSRNEDTKAASAMHGLARALCFNMIYGVSQGYETVSYTHLTLPTKA